MSHNSHVLPGGRTNIAGELDLMTKLLNCAYRRAREIGVEKEAHAELGGAAGEKIPPAWLPATTVTGTRVPRMTGLP